MGEKVTVTDLTNIQNSSAVPAINANTNKVADEFDKVLYRDGSFTMDGNLDINSHRIINLLDAVNPSEPITKRQADQYAAIAIGEGVLELVAQMEVLRDQSASSQSAAAISEANAAGSASAANSSANAAQMYATNAQASADAANLSTPIYPDETTGRAATADNGYFRVAGDNTNTFVLLYRRINAGSSTLITSYVSKTAFDSTYNQMASIAGLSAAAVDVIGTYSAMQYQGRVPKIVPSATWNGTAGTGWTSGEPTASVLRQLTDAPQPEIAPFYPYNRMPFNSKQRILIKAVARDLNYPVTVRVHLEGNTVDITAPTNQTYIGDDGVKRDAWLYAVDFDHANFSTSGRCRFYLEAIPSQPGFVSRIIGPFEMKRKVGNLWDSTVTFGAGGTFADFKAAIIAMKSAPYTSQDHVMLKPTVSHSFDVGAVSGWGISTARWGQVFVNPDPGVTFRIYKASWAAAGQQSALRPGLEGLVFGPGVEIDCGRLGAITGETAHRPFHFAGSRIYDPNGRDTLFGNGTTPLGGETTAENPTEKTTRINQVLNSTPGAFLTEVRCSGFYRSILCGQPLARNCKVQNIAEDSMSCSTTWPWILQYGNEVRDQSAETLRAPYLALTLKYNGAAPTATVTISGPANANGRKFTLTEGAIVTDIPLSVNATTGVYTVQDLANYITANFPNWVATVINNKQRAANLGQFQTITNADAKNQTLNINSAIDVHADVWQIQLQNVGNLIVANNSIYGLMSGQIFYFGLVAGIRMVDCVFQNNYVDDQTFQYVSNFFGTQSNVRIENHSQLRQPFALRADSPTFPYSPDALCRIINSVGYGSSVFGSPTIVEIAYNQFLNNADASPNTHDNVISSTIGNSIMDMVDSTSYDDVYNRPRLAKSLRGPFR